MTETRKERIKGAELRVSVCGMHTANRLLFVQNDERKLLLVPETSFLSPQPAYRLTKILH